VCHLDSFLLASRCMRRPAIVCDHFRRLRTPRSGANAGVRPHSDARVLLQEKESGAACYNRCQLNVA